MGSRGIACLVLVAVVSATAGFVIASKVGTAGEGAVGISDAPSGDIPAKGANPWTDSDVGSVPLPVAEVVARSAESARAGDLAAALRSLDEIAVMSGDPLVCMFRLDAPPFGIEGHAIGE